MRVLYLIGMAMLGLAQPTVAFAQHPLVLAKLQELNTKAPQPSIAELKAAISLTAKASGGANATCVPSGVVLGEVAPVTGARDILPAVLGGELRNAWSVYVTHRGCPGTNPFRYMVVQKSDGNLLAPMVNEGKTYANPSIMRDTSAQAAIAALQKARSLDAACTGEMMKMGPTKVTAQSDDLGPDLFGARYVGSWSESWRFETCGRTFEVPVEFRSDGDGGAYTNIKSDQVVVVR